MGRLHHERGFQVLLVLLGIAATGLVAVCIVGIDDPTRWPDLRAWILLFGGMTAGLLIAVLIVVAVSGGREVPPALSFTVTAENLATADRLEGLLAEGRFLNTEVARGEPYRDGLEDEFDAWRERVIDVLPMGKRPDFRDTPESSWYGYVGEMQRIVRVEPSLGFIETAISELRGE